MRQIRQQSGGLLSRRTRQHAGPKRRACHGPRTQGGQGSRRKLRIGIDGRKPQIRAAGFATSNGGDAPRRPERLDRIPPGQETGRVTAEGAFDTGTCHDASAARGAAAILPRRQNAGP